MQSENLIGAAKAVLAQWDTPNWKLTEPTAKLMADLRKAVDEAALSDAEPAAWVYAPDLAKGSGGFGKERGSVLMSLDGEWINVDTPLYAAPPAPVAVEDLIAEVHDAIDEYREGMKGDKFGPHEWPTVDGIKTTVAQSLRRSALSAQVQDVAGWQSMDTAPKDGSEFAAGRRYSPDGEFVVHTYRWVGPPNYWNSKRNGICIRPSYQADYMWCPLPAAPAKQEG